MEARVEFKKDNQIKARLRRANIMLAPRVLEYCKSKTDEFEDYMKSHAPWRDRTGNARRGLKARASQSKNGYVTTIELSHSVFYGIYLEYYYGGKYAIINPTIRVKGPDLERGLQGYLKHFI